MSLPNFQVTNKGFKELVKLRFLDKFTIDSYQCNCGRKYPLEKVTVVQGFFICPYCKTSRKFNERNLIKDEKYEVNKLKLLNEIKLKLSQLDVVFEERFSELFLKINGSFIPITLLEDSNASLLDPNNYSLILYYHEQDFIKYSNIYSQKRMISLGDFFAITIIDFKRMISLQEKYIKNSIVSKIKDQIVKFASNSTSLDFEKEVNNLFEKFKAKSEKIEEMLSFFNKYRNLMIAKKPVHIGGNHPSDIEFIDLFEYFNKLFDLNQNKSADAKRYYESEITRSTITDKLNTNFGKELIIVTNKPKVSNGAWQYIWNARKEHGEWKYFILDLDLLSLLIYHLDLQNDLFLSSVEYIEAQSLKGKGNMA